MTDRAFSPASDGSAAPPSLKDKYGIPYRITGKAPNGITLLQRLVPPMLNEDFILVPTPDYTCPQRTALEDRFELTRSDDTPLAEVILPVSSVVQPLQGVLITVPVGQMARGTAWKPDWQRASAPWNALACLADALEELHLQHLHPARLTRDMLFISPDDAEIRLILADADQLTPAMQADPLLAPMLPPELRQPGASDIGPAQNACMFAALVLSLLADWAPGGDGQPLPHQRLIAGLPDALPQASLLKETLTQAFSAAPAQRPGMAAWKDLLKQCAAQAGISPACKAAPVPPADGNRPTSLGRQWQLGSSEDVIIPAVCHGSAYRLPDAQWQPWHPVFASLPGDLPGQLHHLRLPDDFIDLDAAPTLLYTTSIHAGRAGWQGLFPEADCERPDLGHILDGLHILLRLLDETELAAKHNIFLTNPDARQFLSSDERLFLVCGQNVADAPDPNLGSQIMQILLAPCACASWLPHEIRRAVLRGTQASTAVWRSMLHYSLTNLVTCPDCGQQHLPNASCLRCHRTSVTLEVKRNQGVLAEQLDIPLADADPIRLSELYPNAPATDEMRITHDTSSDRFIITNLSARSWRYRASDDVTRNLAPRGWLPLTPGLRIALLPGQLELCYNWPR